MSANNQLIIAPYTKDLERYALWMDHCVDNPFDFSSEPIEVFDTFEEAARKATEVQKNSVVEYGTAMIFRDQMIRYERRNWHEFPDYMYTVPVFTSQ